MVGIERLINEVRLKAEETSFSGAVSIYQGNKTLYNEAFGYADFTEKREINLKTKFAIASGTKLFTALGIGSLIDSGKLSLDTTVYDIFHKKLSFVDSGATIAQLLTHTSGIFDYYDEDMDIDPENYFVDIPWSKLETPTDYLPLFQGKQPKYLPGERFSYSNGGYIFCGIIIERITGKLYRDYIREKVFEPAGMIDSGYYAFNRLPKNTANGYILNSDGTYRTNIYNLPIRGASDGGAYTTIMNIHKLWKALVGHRILSEKLTEAFLTPHATLDDYIDYGYGIYITEYLGNRVLFFSGGDAGVGFDSRYIPEKDIQVTIISNLTDGEEKIREVIFFHLGEYIDGSII
jgi:CubicO group peptidase (beta-lactamase class C family)